MASISIPKRSGPPSGSDSTRTSVDTARSGTPSLAASIPSRSPLPRSPSRQASITSPIGNNGPASASLQPGAVPARRNRAALRDYYGLKKPPDSSATRGDSPDPARDDGDESVGAVADRELDEPGFEAAAYVENLLSNQGLEGLLRTESGLVNEIKFLTSERAALVYDNYSKLIAATDTIKRMRGNMAPLAPATSTLAPAVAHIADTAEHLAFKTSESPRTAREAVGLGVDLNQGVAQEAATDATEEREKRQRDRATVRWVLDTPRRIRDEGPEDAEWETVRGLLDRWGGMAGIDELRAECEKAVDERGPGKV